MSHRQYVRLLNSAWAGPRYGLENVTGTIFKTTEDGKHTLKYEYLEAYARETNVPSAMILLLSRIRSELSPVAKPDRAYAVLRGMRAAIVALEEQVSANDLDVRACICAYKDAGGPAAN